MKEFDNLKFVFGDSERQFSVKGTVLTDKPVTIEVESMTPEEAWGNCFNNWSSYLGQIGEFESVSCDCFIHYPTVYKHRKLVKRPGSGQRRAVLFRIKAHTTVLRNVTPIGIGHVQPIDASKMLEMHYESQELKNE